ncbi:hypothetical protein PHMEG_00010678 [Phytophthora megakarya]|uniref:Uncharacterized protein n=1 Tax=Phytophthora megakarya TaxID=4795 RepID=A0A225WFK9_9STRA|nr:hypothetical protein PHMEG_00010678 [Phytophthora megakarya]
MFSSLSGIKVLIWICQLMVLIVSILEDGHLLIVVKSLSREPQQASFSASDHADLRVHSANFDHVDAITLSLELVWPHIEILTCSEHLYLGSLASKQSWKSRKASRRTSANSIFGYSIDTFTKPIQGCLKTSHKCVDKRLRRCSRQLASNSLPGSTLGAVKREQFLRFRIYSNPAANRE